MFPSVTIRRSSSAGAACGKRSSLATKTPSRSRTISHPAAASPSSRNSRPCSIKTEIIPKLSIRHASLRQGVPLSFACAYVPNKMLLQGVLNFKEGVHAFVFSSIFLREEIILPFESVISVEKSKLGFIPNSLTIRAHGGKEYFFTSFLNRDYAYEFSLEQLHQWALHRKHEILDHPQSQSPTEHTFLVEGELRSPPQYVNEHEFAKSPAASPRRRVSEAPSVVHQRILASARISAAVDPVTTGKKTSVTSSKESEHTNLTPLGAETRRTPRTEAAAETTALALHAPTLLFMLVTAFATFCVAMAVTTLWAWFKLSSALVALDAKYPVA